MRHRSMNVEVTVPANLAKQYSTIFSEHDLDERADDIQSALGRYNATEVTINLAGLNRKILSDMLGVSGGRRNLVTLMNGLIRVMNDPQAKISNLRLLPDALAGYIKKDAIDGWLYSNKEGEERYAYLVESIEYHEGDRRNTKDSVVVSLKANRPKQVEERGGKEVHTQKIYFDSDDIRGESAASLLIISGWLKETKELRAEYDRYFDLFNKYAPRVYEQFTGQGLAIENDHWRTNRYAVPAGSKFVNDEALVQRNITTRSDNDFWREYVEGLSELGTFSEIPVHPLLLMFDLQRHCYAWMHVASVEPYVYDKTVRDKLILPKDHRDLIDILTSDISVFEEDIIRGKSGGTPVLCYGKPGLGKTLTAEVYSEIMRKPLYRIDAGQLGISQKDVESNLETILKRAERWGAILLIDEADVYIRKRADDISQNAIVAAFLRTLEYFNGLLFMTTNRAEDVDDAIVSRMVAVFKYDTPTAEMREPLWKVLASQFDCNLNAPIKELVREFPEVSGRDIKQLLRLTRKYCAQKKVSMDVEAFRICAMFRGLK